MPFSPGIRRALAWAPSILALAACGDSGKPVRLVVGVGDTFVVHSQKPTAITAEGHDAEGNAVAVTGVTYRQTGGDSVSLTADGTVTCTRKADAMVVATAGELSATAFVRCRPVKSVRISGPVQFFMGDTAQRLETQILGLDGKPLDVIAGTVSVLDRSVVGAEGMRVSARGVGITLLTLTVGDSSATTGVHVYQPVDAIVNLKPEQRLVAVRLSLRHGEYRRWTLPAGTWMITMLPYKDEKRGIRLSVKGAACVPEHLTPRRISCFTKDSALVTVEHPSKVPAPELEGQILVRNITMAEPRTP
jgi:hypothetical protein